MFTKKTSHISAKQITSLPIGEYIYMRIKGGNRKKSVVKLENDGKVSIHVTVTKPIQYKDGTIGELVVYAGAYGTAKDAAKKFNSYA